MNDAILARKGVCPLCQTGPFRSLAIHLANKHAVKPQDLKRWLGMDRAEPLTAPDVQASNRANAERVNAEHDKWNRKIPADFAPILQARLADGERMKHIAADLGCSPSALSQFVRRHSIDTTMRRREPTPDGLLDTVQVAALLGVIPASVQRMRQPDRPGPPFPAPARHFGRTPVWEGADILAWRQTRPGSGRQVTG